MPLRKCVYTHILVAWCTLPGDWAARLRHPAAAFSTPCQDMATVSTIHGEERVDAYAWLRQQSDPRSWRISRQRTSMPRR